MNKYQAIALRALRLSSGLEGLIQQALNYKAAVQVINQPAHGFAVGDWVYSTGGTYALADRDAAASVAMGVVSKKITDDQFELTTHGIVDSLSGLSTGSTYYLSSTAGAMTSSTPATGLVQVLGEALSATQFRVEMQRPKIPALELDRGLIGNANIETNVAVTGGGAVTVSGGGNVTVTGGDIETDQQIKSTVTTGTPPFEVASTDTVTNLNADTLDGSHSSAFSGSGHNHDADYMDISELDTKNFNPQSADPADPDTGKAVMWLSDGTESGNAGDIMIKSNVGGTTKTGTVIAYSAMS